MGTPFSSIGKSGVGQSRGLYKDTWGDRQVGYYNYQATPDSTSSSQVGAGDNSRWETTVNKGTTGVTDIGRSADERRIYLISKGMSDVPSYTQWRDGAGRDDFKRKEWGNDIEGGYLDVANTDVFSYHEYLDKRFGGDSFSRQRDGSTLTNSATSTDPAVQALRASATTRDTGGTQAVEATAAEPKRRGRRGATLAALDSSVDKPTILGG